MAPLPPSDRVKRRSIQTSKNPVSRSSSAAANNSAKELPARSAFATHPAENDDTSPFGEQSSKRDKRQMKHSILLSKLRARSASKIQKKRRRPAKKLKGGDVGDLEAALEEAVLEAAAEVPVNGKSRSQSGLRQSAKNTIKSRPGVQMKRDRIADLERERMAQNLAIMSADSALGNIGAEDGRKARWEILRKHIQGTMTTG